MSTKYCNLIGPLQVVYSTYYPRTLITLAENTYHTHREHLLHSPQTLITPAVQNNVLKVIALQYRCGVTIKQFKL